MYHVAEGAAAPGAAEGKAPPARAAGESFPVVLVSPYELGRQPFGIAEAAAWLRDAGFPVRCIDLSRERLDPEALRGAGLVAVHLPMHTAGRIAAAAFGRIRTLAPRARLAVFGLYAPVNDARFRELGAEAVLGGEVEPALVALARECRDGHGRHGRSQGHAHTPSSARDGAQESAAGAGKVGSIPHRGNVSDATDARSRAKQGRGFGARRFKQCESGQGNRPRNRGPAE